MIQQELQKQQWKAFKRHPMFDRNMGVKIFMFIMFGFLGLQLLSLGFVLDNLLLKVGKYNNAIDTFNSFLLYIFLPDFITKYTFKQNNSMQIAPYLSLPIKRNKLFNFLLVKEFSNIWNLYWFFLVIPFAIKSITPYSGFGTALLYILFFYLVCVANSLLVNIANNIQKRNGWFFLLPYLFAVVIIGLSLLPGVHFDIYTEKIGGWVLANNPLVWFVLLGIMYGLWKINQRIMRYGLYQELQGKKIENTTSFSRLSFLDRLGETGEFINLEIKMILRSKRLKHSMYTIVLFLVFYLIMLYSPENESREQLFSFVFFNIFLVGYLGLIMSQYMFTAESSFFDGLMTRDHSLLNMLKGKYILYSSYSLIITILLMIPVYQGKLDFLFLVSVFFYTIGFLYFLMFQNAVYNKSHFDLFDEGMMSWKGTSGNMLVVTLLGMFLPIALVMIIYGLFSETIACYFMLTVGLLFTLTVNYWLKWTYGRFLKRKYKNMEGFRSNG